MKQTHESGKSVFVNKWIHHRNIADGRDREEIVNVNKHKHSIRWFSSFINLYGYSVAPVFQMAHTCFMLDMKSFENLLKRITKEREHVLYTKIDRVEWISL